MVFHRHAIKIAITFNITCIYLFKVINGITKTMCKICSKLTPTLKTPEDVIDNNDVNDVVMDDIRME